MKLEGALTPLSTLSSPRFGDFVQQQGWLPAILTDWITFHFSRFSPQVFLSGSLAALSQLDLA